jgi:hypothetical protein
MARNKLSLWEHFSFAVRENDPGEGEGGGGEGGLVDDGGESSGRGDGSPAAAAATVAEAGETGSYDNVEGAIEAGDVVAKKVIQSAAEKTPGVTPEVVAAIGEVGDNANGAVADAAEADDDPGDAELTAAQVEFLEKRAASDTQDASAAEVTAGETLSRTVEKVGKGTVHDLGVQADEAGRGKEYRNADAAESAALDKYNKTKAKGGKDPGPVEKQATADALKDYNDKSAAARKIRSELLDPDGTYSKMLEAEGGPWYKKVTEAIGNHWKLLGILGTIAGLYLALRGICKELTGCYIYHGTASQKLSGCTTMVEAAAKATKAGSYTVSQCGCAPPASTGSSAPANAYQTQCASAPATAIRRLGSDASSSSARPSAVGAAPGSMPVYCSGGCAQNAAFPCFGIPGKGTSIYYAFNHVTALNALSFAIGNTSGNLKQAGKGIVGMILTVLKVIGLVILVIIICILALKGIKMLMEKMKENKKVAGASKPKPKPKPKSKPVSAAKVQGAAAPSRK